ncbi:MAG TPA: tRNA pseudouridine(38-40) synthase TruA [Clostridia bacterium]|nr:tRNA pseudouridine(38-40) synthase TruA [Clostridia bacterium]
MKRNIKLTIEYDGTNYGGWQRQVNSPTIQQELEEGLFKLTGEDIGIQGAGRTDGGVHARGQVANFFTKSSIAPQRFGFALNSVIPPDIRIVRSEEVESDFHSRFCAKARHYRYSMVTGPQGIAIGRDYYYHVPVPLDMGEMEKAIVMFKGTQDFKAFQASGSIARTTVRTIYDARLTFQDPFLYLDILGDGFLYNMVRIIAGTLLYVGKGKIDYNNIVEIIKMGDRRLAGPTAPPHGLCLQKVYYPGDDIVLS